MVKNKSIKISEALKMKWEQRRKSGYSNTKNNKYDYRSTDSIIKSIEDKLINHEISIYTAADLVASKILNGIIWKSNKDEQYYKRRKKLTHYLQILTKRITLNIIEKQFNDNRKNLKDIYDWCNIERIKLSQLTESLPY
jgi:hypothetical protein